MVCDEPDPMENNPDELNLPPRHDLIMNATHADDSDENEHDYFGYEPLPQGPEIARIDTDNDDDAVQNTQDSTPSPDVPPIEPMENVLTREVWNTPRHTDPIHMDNERAQEVMSAMANFSLPESSIPDWAQSISEDQWQQTLMDRIEKIKHN